MRGSKSSGGLLLRLVASGTELLGLGLGLGLGLELRLRLAWNTGLL